MTTTAPSTDTGRPSGVRGAFSVWLDRVSSILTAPGPSDRIQRSVLGATVLGCALIRALTVGNPPLDRTEWKEIDYIMLADNFRHGAPFIYPTVTWPAEAPRFTAMEFPLVPYLTGLLEQLFGTAPLVVRLVTLLAFVAVAVYVSLLVRRQLGPWAAMVAGVAAAVLPLLHPFGRFLFSEPLMLACALAALYHLARWLDEGRVAHAVAGTALLSLAVALKLEVAFWLWAPLVCLVRESGRRGVRGWRAPLGLGAVALLLPVAWYAWAAHLEVTGVHEFSVFRGHDKFQIVSSLTSVHWWTALARRLFDQLLGGPVGVVLAVLGVTAAAGMFRRSKLRAGILLWAAYGLGIVFYVLLVAEGQLDAPYRQLTAVPVLAVLVALGAIGAVAAADVLRQRGGNTTTSSAWVSAAAMVLVLAIAPANVGAIIGDRSPDSDRLDYAATISRYAHAGDELAVLGEYDTKVGGNDISPLLFYYTGLRGWILQPPDCSAGRVEELARKGATLFAVVPPFGQSERATCGEEGSSELASVLARHPVLVDDGALLLVDLRVTR